MTSSTTSNRCLRHGCATPAIPGTSYCRLHQPHHKDHVERQLATSNDARFEPFGDDSSATLYLIGFALLGYLVLRVFSGQDVMIATGSAVAALVGMWAFTIYRRLRAIARSVRMTFKNRPEYPRSKGYAND